MLSVTAFVLEITLPTRGVDGTDVVCREIQKYFSKNIQNNFMDKVVRVVSLFALFSYKVYDLVTGINSEYIIINVLKQIYLYGAS